MKILSCTLLVLVAASMTACSSQKREPRARSTEFPAEDSYRAVRQILDAQIAEGAADDARLTADHFSGGELNDSGRDRLHWIARANRQPLVVQLDIADDEIRASRRQSLERWLADAGVRQDDVRISFGSNASVRTPASTNLNRYLKTESPGPVASGSVTARAAGASSAPGTGTGMSSGPSQ